MTSTNWVIVALIWQSGHAATVETRNYYLNQETCLVAAHNMAVEFYTLTKEKTYHGIIMPKYACVPASNGTLHQGIK